MGWGQQLSQVKEELLLAATLGPFGTVSLPGSQRCSTAAG